MPNKHNIKSRFNFLFKFRLICYLIIFTLVLLLSIISVSAEITSGEQFWKETKYNFAENSPIYGAYYDNPNNSHMMLFYPVEDWEIEVCTRDLTSSTSGNKNNPSTNSLYSMKFSSTTIALTASKYAYESLQETLYNLEWYIQSIDTEVIYSIYLTDSTNTKFYIQEYTDISVPPMGRSVKVFSNYYPVNYTTLVIEYHNADSVYNSTMKTEIVSDNKAKYG